ncbi:MAG TPA: hypothetical protein PKC91_09905 [Ignavibacteria bacterium]|nr:hypothetical protein [Ignavibacteria bacterium]
MILRRFHLQIIFIAVLCSSVLFNSCSDDTVTTAPPPAVTQDLIFLDTAYAIGGRALVSIYVEETLKVGYNNVYIVLKDSVTGATITDAHVEFDLLNHGVGTPVENPDKLAVDGKFKGAWILTAAQAGDNALHWHYHIHVHNHQAPGEPEGEAEFGDFLVKENPDGFKSITMPDSTKLFLSFINPDKPVTGMNDFEFLINKNEPDLFPADGSYTVQMNPVFLPNGHTTSNNVNPAGASDGHYNGRVNFDQSGAWRVNLKIMKNEHEYDTYFDVTY